MNYELTVALSKRKCHFCSNKIEKKGMHFRMHYWTEHTEYPIVRNICPACAVRFYDDKWVGFLKGLIKKAGELRVLASQPNQEGADDVERCKRCGSNNIKREGNFFLCQQCGTIELSKKAGLEDSNAP